MLFYALQVLQSVPLMVPLKDLLNELHAPLLKYGWRQLAHSTPLADLSGGLSVVSLWTKEIPRLPGAG
jgi:hypothetical protein